MRHIAFIIPGLDHIGGAERQMLDLAEGLAARQWRVSAIALSGRGDALTDRLARRGIPLHNLAMRKGLVDPRGWLRMHHWIRCEAPDIVHAHLPHGTLMARWARLFAPVRVLVDTVHTSAIGGMGRKMSYRSSNWLSDHTTLVSHDAASAWLDTGLLTTKRYSVLPNGVAIDQWRPNTDVRASMRTRLQLGDEFVWLAAGRLEAVKDYRTLLTAMSLLPASACLLIAGSGALEAELRQQAAAMRLDGRVRFLGFLPDLRALMQAADGVALTSRWEGLPMVLLEAAACALPAVATNVAGTREVILPGRTGYLCLPGDPTGIAAAMLQVMQLAPEARRAMGERARQRAVAEFSLQDVLDRWEALYSELLQRNLLRARWAR